MDSKKYNRTITLLCPTCGGSDFKFEECENSFVQCVQCERELTRQELEAENSELIQESLNEVKTQVSEDIEKMLVDAFRGNKHIRFK